MADTYLDLFWAYAVLWGLVCWFIISVISKQNELKNRLAKVEEAINEKNNSPF